MLRLTNLKIGITDSDETVKDKALRKLHLTEEDISVFRLVKKSLDARHKPDLFYNCTVDLVLRRGSEKKIVSRHNNVMSIKKENYRLPVPGRDTMKHRPVIVGAGPAGLFCAYALALKGYAPIIIERGDDVDTRTEKVRRLWEEGILDTESNAQFGEGGAGTFSDGKLNTSVKDPSHRKDFVLETLVSLGAPESILSDQKPHLGTDVLTNVMKAMRRRIEELGGHYRFRHAMTDILLKEGSAEGLEINGSETLAADVIVLAIGHSSRDTYRLLEERGFILEPKAFAVGLRVEHRQDMIDRSQYGRQAGNDLPPAPYKLTAQTEEGRGVYTFCMCPGGYVVNASSEEGHLCVNGMSYHDRGSGTANSAVIVTVTPEDYHDYENETYHGALGGIAFQRELEKRAFDLAGGRIPVQTLADFRQGTLTDKAGCVEPRHKGCWQYARVDTILPPPLTRAVSEGMTVFGHKIRGFDDPDTLMCGVEARTSSPVRILRNDALTGTYEGIYPVGEGAGYAGGITSAAIDGLRAAEKIIARYGKPDL